MNTKEIWADIGGCDSVYQISNFGNIRSWIKQGSKNKKRTPFSKLLKLSTNKGGYKVCNIALRTIKKKSVLVHRMVAEAFIPNPQHFRVVMHKDDDKSNNHFLNLEWGTHSKNNSDALSRSIRKAARGSRLNKSALTDEDVLFIFKSSESDRSLSKKFGVNHTTISAIRSGKSWNHVTKLKCTRKSKPKYLPKDDYHF